MRPKRVGGMPITRDMAARLLVCSTCVQIASLRPVPRYRRVSLTFGKYAHGLRRRCLSLALIVLDFVGFRAFEGAIPRADLVRMLDFCWISRRAERLFASPKTSKACVDLLVRAVGGDGFEPPTPAL